MTATYIPKKPCRKCGTSLRYVKSRGCIECNRTYAKKHSSRYAGRYKAQNTKWRRDHPQACRRWQLNHLYGLSVEDFNQILEKQHNQCAICHKQLIPGKDTNVDHQGSVVRGILCGSCNRAIGLLKHSLVILQSAIDYLRNHVL